MYKLVTTRIQVLRQNIYIYYFLLFVVNIPLFVLIWYLLRVTTFDYFVIPSESMFPTLTSGDKVIVNKLLMGGRIYNDFHFNIIGQELSSWRLKGLRSVKRNDICVFNHPIHLDEISFVINHVLCKRCVALPGDTIIIKNGKYINNNYNRKYGNIMQNESVLDIDTTTFTDKIVGDELGWSILHFGPMYIPRKGDEMDITPREAIIYKHILQWEIGKNIYWDTSNGLVTADNVPLTHHIWEHNYYFMAGDNICHSIDSRYWGLVPEEYIVGIVKLIIHNGHFQLTE